MASIEFQWVLWGLHHRGGIGTHRKAVVDILGAVLCHVGIFENYFLAEFVLKRGKERKSEREESEITS